MTYRLGGGVLILLGVALYLILQGTTGAVQIDSSLSSVKVYEVTANSTGVVRDFPGKVVASASADLATKVGGRIQKIYFQPGDIVKKGDVLLQIDPVDYQLNYETAQANLTLAQATYNRIASSFKKGVSTQSDLDNVQAQLDLAKISVRQARNQLADTKLIAPYDGIVVRTMSEEYEFVTATQPLMFFQSQEAILVDFQVPSDIISRVRNIDNLPPVSIRFDALPEVYFEASVKEFSADSDATTRAYDVTLTMPLPEEHGIRLLPGMDATVEIEMAASEIQQSGVVVPSHAVFLDGGQASVWVVSEGQVTKVPVSIGQLRTGGVEVLEGLSAGDTIVTAGVYQLTENQMVNIWAGE